MIKEGSKVSLHYTLNIDGEVVDSSIGKEPLDFVQGSGEVIPGLEKEIDGLKVGDKKSITVSPEEGFGKRSDEAVQTIPRSAFDSPENLKVGDVVSGEVEDQSFQAVVTSFDDENITLDMNHPLAGKSLNFEIEVVSVKG